MASLDPSDVSVAWTCPPQQMNPPVDQTMVWTPENSINRDLGQGGLRIAPNTGHEVMVQLRSAFTLKASVASQDTSGAAVLDKWFLVDLNNTVVSVASPHQPTGGGDPGDVPGSSGWYVDRVDVEIGFTDDVPGLSRWADAPGASSFKGNSTSTVTTGVTAGFFGDTLTGGFSRSWSNSFSFSMDDFGVTSDTSGPTRALQTYKLQTTGSALYSSPLGLLGGNRPWWVNASGAPPYTLQALPPKATSNLPIPSQAMFTTTPVTDTKTRVRIRITPNFVCVAPTVVDSASDLPQEYQAEAFEAFMGDLEPPIGRWGFYEVHTLNEPFEWATEVDFSAVDLKL